jgi:two-component system nitrogen regulation response regulator NtrX
LLSVSDGAKLSRILSNMRAASGLKAATRLAATAVSDGTIPLPLVGASDVARRARLALQLAAGRRTPVLLLAETGCRPHAVVDSLHAQTRPGGAVVVLDCGATEAGEIDERLFGAPRRGAVPRDLEALGRGSAIVTAASGTLYLDNVDELPASAQRRLARLLRDGEARIASRSHSVALPFRLVGSTTRDIETEVREGRFRADLLRRFAACRITIPPLRQRPGDLTSIIERAVHEIDGGTRRFTQPAITVLAALPWAQNIDELVSVLTRVIAGAGVVVTQEDVLAHVPMEGAFARWDLTASLREARRRFERDYIASVLERHQWSMSNAARALGIERANLYRKTRQLGIARVAKAELS